MSSNVNRNSLIMASGTMASRITGQIRTILLAACLGTTGIAANAYQTGAMIPQVLFTVISGGIFNAVLVPQIVRTLKDRDAETQLNKLVTLAMIMLLALTLLMMAATPLLTMLYLDSSWNAAQRALVNSFTLWCMPQVFFYGLYTVLGQILAAKDNFATYAWSSVGANVISCLGFVLFLMLFGPSSQAPLAFWTTSKVVLTAGTWTLGVAFQALVLFVPLLRLGFRYRPCFGIHGIGLRSMGPVAAWSFGVMVVQELANIINTRITNGAPAAGGDLYGIAGNASYQYAFTLYILPYSLIAVSIATAIFPKISRAVADANLDAARADLSASLRNLSIMMMFFAAAMAVMPVPITIALLPSVDVAKAELISGPLIMLALGLPFTSAYLLIQRTFYAFEDGKHPFLFQCAVHVTQVVLVLGCTVVFPPRYWAISVALTSTLGYTLCFPALVLMMRRRFEGYMDGRRIAMTYAKTCAAAVVAGLVAWLLTNPIMSLLGASPSHGRLNWFQAIGFCVISTILLAVVYAGALVALRCGEFTALLTQLTAKLSRGASNADPAAVPPAPPAPPSVEESTEPTEEPVEKPMEESTEKSTEEPAEEKKVERAAVSAIPVTKMVTVRAHISAQSPARDGVGGMMEPQLADTLFNRYTLVASVRNEPGIQAWKANDRVLDRSCQLFIITATDALEEISSAVSSVGRRPGFTQVMQFRKAGDAAVLITDMEAGLSLTEYLYGRTHDVLSMEAIRSIIGETAMLAATVRAPRLSTDTIRISSNGLEIADAVIANLLVEPTHAPAEMDGEPLTIRQLAAVLYALVTKTPSDVDTVFDMQQVGEEVPSEFRVIISRGLGLNDGDARIEPMMSLSEIIALLGEWTPLRELSDQDLALPNDAGEGSIATTALRHVDDRQLMQLPSDVISRQKLRDLTIARTPEETPSKPEEQEKPEKPEPMEKGEENLAKLASAASKSSNLWQKRDSNGDNGQSQKYRSADLFNDFSFQTDPVSVNMMPGEMTTYIPSASTGNLPTQALDVSAFRVGGAAQFGTAQPGVAQPGADQPNVAQPGTSEPAGWTQPPSFAPQTKHASGDEDDSRNDLANRRLFGKATTATVVVAVAAVTVVVALAFAIHTFIGNGNSVNPKDVENNNWSDTNFNNVPFGDSENGTSNENSSSQQAAGESDDIEIIDVTDLLVKW
ncbi:murein biosynthesis integral membrane protein MurJ [Bifidobacterium panos]|uniref:MviN-like protein n=1 Tax=Bifidobacterium panos TaxID=2675321 RepID=A0ABX1SY06_9BIFI|nr:murein biosynthesis integral membrane protein MurJ [Bifidobacterium sp. DSM 109963]NMN02716.1 MviN-like protein [Bifidobacterium sp. DSM 109963]